MDERLKEKGMIVISKFQCCSKLEYVNHVMISNDEVWKVWRWFARIFQVQINWQMQVSHLFRAWSVSSDYVTDGHIRIIIPLVVGWYVWLARNAAKYEGNKIKSELINYTKSCGFLAPLSQC